MENKYIEWLEGLGFYPVSTPLWNVVEIKHTKPKDDLERKETEAFLKKTLENKNGLYVYESFDKQILYVGKGKPIINRLISHYIESFQSVSGDSKNQKWHRFFKANSGILKVYWRELEGENERQLVEKMLDSILNPVFNEFDKKPEVIPFIQIDADVKVRPVNIIKEEKITSVNKELDYFFGDYKEDIISKITFLLGSSFTPKYNKTGVTYFGYKGRILKVIKRQKILEVEFNVPITKIPGVIVLTDKEAREKKMGTCRWIYKGESLATVLKLVEEAVGNY